MTAEKREKLPERRGSETFEFQCSNVTYFATVSRYPDGRPAEIFLSSNKNGSDADVSARDSAVVASLALQYGAPLNKIRESLTREASGRASSPLGAALTEVAKWKPPE